MADEIEGKLLEVCSCNVRRRLARPLGVALILSGLIVLDG